MAIDLSRTHAGHYNPGRSYAVRALWLVVDAVLFSNALLVSYRF
jgi:hypothetical protein